MGYSGTATFVILPLDTVICTCTGPYLVSTACPVKMPSLSELPDVPDDGEADGDEDAVEPDPPEPDVPELDPLDWVPLDEPVDDEPFDDAVPVPLVSPVDAVGATLCSDVR
ncbi:hypothetical protein GCM10027568_15340 [Humibacter soli]